MTQGAYRQREPGIFRRRRRELLRLLGDNRAQGFVFRILGRIGHQSFDAWKKTALYRQFGRAVNYIQNTAIHQRCVHQEELPVVYCKTPFGVCDQCWVEHAFQACIADAA